jgi:hypothetical protein
MADKSTNTAGRAVLSARSPEHGQWAKGSSPRAGTFGGRWVWIGLAGVAVVTGLALSWNWLVAAGLAPLLALLPCAAMCGLHLCMNRGGKEGCAKEPSPDQPPQLTAPVLSGRAEANPAKTLI